MSVIIQKGNFDNTDYVDFINYAFGMNGVSSSFYSLLPKLFGKDKDPARNTYFAIENGRAMGCVGSFPIEFSIGGTTLNLRGIGNVATHPNARGKGYMKTLMNLAVSDMCKDGIDLSVLGGRRHRYNFFGFEKCDCGMKFDITEKTFNYILPDFTSDILMKRVEDSDIEALYSAMSKRSYRAVRKKDELFNILISWNSVPYVFYKGDTLVGWAIHYPSKRLISEFVPLDADFVPDMIYLLLKKLSSLLFEIPSFDTSVCNAIFPFSENVNIQSNVCFSVLNWQRVLDALLKYKADISKLCDGELIVRINGIRCTENLCLSVTGNVADVSVTDRQAALELSQLEALQLAFMSFAPLRSALSPDVASWFPLPIYIFSADNV